MFPQNSCPLLFPPINKQPLPFYPKDDNNDIDSRKEIYRLCAFCAPKYFFGENLSLSDSTNRHVSLLSSCPLTSSGPHPDPSSHIIHYF
jgi:hypothetical protein